MDKSSLYGMFRAKVVDNKDVEMFGRVLVWIPDVMPTVSEAKGIWARPANNPLGGRNLEGDEENYYAGSSYIPRIGSFVWIFFECGNISHPYYFGALDLENAKVLPENQLGDNPEDKWTIFKSPAGRCVIISDDPDDERVEITGKKRNLTDPPSGDTNSVYTIDSNQTTILLDERSGKEKLLIRTYKGDFIHIDIDQQQLQCYFKKDITIETEGTLNLKANDDLKIECGKNMYQKSGQSINRKATMDISDQAGGGQNIRSGQNINLQSGANLNLSSGGTISANGTTLFIQMGAGPAKAATEAVPKEPDGSRDT